ncbi:unnamed protein product, partial [Mesorhabditis spiculigera]
MAQEDSKSGSSEEQSPKYWRAILGDICQLPSFPRATGDPNRYVECVRQAADVTDRKDLGIWLLRECLPGYEFVASARRCKTKITFSQYQNCPCPQQQPQCKCVTQQNNQNCQTTTTQQQYCPQQQEVVQQPQSCPLGSQPASLPTPAPYVPTQAQQNSQCGCTGGVQIGSCNQNYQCPGQSVCQCMVCCYFRKKAKRA